MEKYQSIIRALYTPSFRSAMIYTNPQWERMSLSTKEAYLRHQKCCALLANTAILEDPNANLVESFKSEGVSDSTGAILPYNLRMAAIETIDVQVPQEVEEMGRLETTVLPSEQPIMLVSSEDDERKKSLMDYEMSDSDEDFEVVNSDDPEEEEEMIGDLPTLSIPEPKYQIIMVEGSNSGRKIQEQYANSWAVPVPQTLYDLIDEKNRLFIEVKVTSDPEKALQNYLEKEPTKQCILCVVDLRNKTIRYSINEYSLPGELKCLEFIQERENAFKNNGLEPTLQESARMSLYNIFPSTIKENHLMWVNDILEATRKPHRPQKFKEFTPENDNPCDFLNYLEDPRNRECPEAKWKGKLLPITYKEWKMTETFEDINIIKEIFGDITILDSHNIEEELDFIEAFKEIIQSLKESEKSTRVATIKRSKCEISQSALNKLGVNMKRKKHNENALCKQPEYWIHEKAKDPGFFNTIIYETSLPHDLPGQPLDPLTVTQLPVFHPIDQLSNNITKSIIDTLISSNTGLAISELINFSSRVGGHYLIDDSKGSTHSCIAAWPLYFNLYGENKEMKRGITGMIIRGPHHVRSSTDKINFIIVEILNDKGFNFALHNIRKGLILLTSAGYLLIRRNAIDRSTPPFWSYANNIVLPIVHLFGERVLKTLNEYPEANSVDIISNSIQKYKSFYMWKMAEMFYWCTQANSECEGMIAVVRKICMQIIAKGLPGRGMNFLTVQGLSNKINDCVISSPLCMWYISSLIDTLTFIRDMNGGSFSLK